MSDIHEESDEKAPIKGAEPEGESEPDAGPSPSRSPEKLLRSIPARPKPRRMKLN